MPQAVEVNLNGVKVKGFLIKKLYKISRKRKINGKVYAWEENMLVFYVPKSLVKCEFLVIPLEKGEK